jgi:hypothetical protein
MRERKVAARTRRRFRTTTDSKHDFPIAPNVLERDFRRERPRSGMGHRPHGRQKHQVQHEPEAIAGTIPSPRASSRRSSASWKASTPSRPGRRHPAPAPLFRHRLHQPRRVRPDTFREESSSVAKPSIRSGQLQLFVGRLQQVQHCPAERTTIPLPFPPPTVVHQVHSDNVGEGFGPSFFLRNSDHM